MKRIILILITLAWAVTIFVFSAQPADTSTNMSRMVGRKFGQYFVPGFENWSQEKQDAFAKKADYPVRKCAHGAEYALLALLLLFLFASFEAKGYKQYMLALGIAVFYAMTDEFHQLFVPGRSGNIIDVLIDSFGAGVGCLIFSLGSMIRRGIAKSGTINVLLFIAGVILIFSTPVTSQAKTYRPGFSYTKISAEMKNQMIGKSYPKSGAKISFSQLRAVKVKYYNFSGKTKTGTLIVNKKIANKVTKIFYELYKMEYPIQRIAPIDKYGGNDEKSMAANNTSAFNYRWIAGSKKLSMHSQGLAIDINPRINPCVKNGVVSPSNGKAYKTRKVKKCKGRYKKYMIHRNDKVYKLFKKHGFIWGGDWNSLKDYQHFEYAK